MQVGVQKQDQPPSANPACLRRRERRQLTRTVADLFRLVPMIIILVGGWALMWMVVGWGLPAARPPVGHCGLLRPHSCSPV